MHGRLFTPLVLTLLLYDGADHAFANPSGGNYNAEATQDSWQKITAFLAKNLKGGTT